MNNTRSEIEIKPRRFFWFLRCELTIEAHWWSFLCIVNNFIGDSWDCIAILRDATKPELRPFLLIVQIFPLSEVNDNPNSNYYLCYPSQVRSLWTSGSRYTSYQVRSALIFRNNYETSWYTLWLHNALWLHQLLLLYGCYTCICERFRINRNVPTSFANLFRTKHRYE
jgi:hypothetical protein